MTAARAGWKILDSKSGHDFVYIPQVHVAHQAQAASQKFLLSSSFFIYFCSYIVPPSTNREKAKKASGGMACLRHAIPNMKEFFAVYLPKNYFVVLWLGQLAKSTKEKMDSCVK